MTIRIMIADDHGIVREGLRSLLDGDEELNVVGEAENGRAAIEQTGELKPDVVIMDVSMPDLNGIEATRRITRDHPAVKVIGLSMHAKAQFVAEMLDAGASGYLLKDCIGQELIDAVKNVKQGGTHLSPQIAKTVVDNYVKDRSGGSVSISSKLSHREREILQLIAEGKSVKEIANDLNISANTVHTHRRHLVEKLDASSDAELTKYALREGLTSL